MIELTCVTTVCPENKPALASGASTTAEGSLNTIKSTELINAIE